MSSRSRTIDLIGPHDPADAGTLTNLVDDDARARLRADVLRASREDADGIAAALPAAGLRSSTIWRYTLPRSTG